VARQLRSSAIVGLGPEDRVPAPKPGQVVPQEPEEAERQQRLDRLMVLAFERRRLPPEEGGIDREQRDGTNRCRGIMAARSS
jgi:hypothetical protein